MRKPGAVRDGARVHAQREVGSTRSEVGRPGGAAASRCHRPEIQRTIQRSNVRTIDSASMLTIGTYTRTFSVS